LTRASRAQLQLALLAIRFEAKPESHPAVCGRSHEDMRRKRVAPASLTPPPKARLPQDRDRRPEKQRLILARTGRSTEWGSFAALDDAMHVAKTSNKAARSRVTFMGRSNRTLVMIASNETRSGLYLFVFSHDLIQKVCNFLGFLPLFDSFHTRFGCAGGGLGAAVAKSQVAATIQRRLCAGKHEAPGTPIFTCP